MKNNKFVIFIKDMINRYYGHEVAISAAALTYYFLFAFFPFLIFINTVLAKFQIDPEFFDMLRVIFPADIINIADAYLEHIGTIPTTGLMVFGLVFSIYFPLRAVSSLIGFISKAYDVKEKRGLIHRVIIMLLLAIGVIILLAISILVAFVGKNLLFWIAKYLPISIENIYIWDTVKFLILAALLIVVLIAIYTVGPSTVIRFKEALPGAVFAVLCWMAFSYGFSIYVQYIAKYSVVYGSIGAIIVLLLWLYATSNTLLLGAEINAEIKFLRTKKYIREY